MKILDNEIEKRANTYLCFQGSPSECNWPGIIGLQFKKIKIINLHYKQQPNILITVLTIVEAPYPKSPSPHVLQEQMTPITSQKVLMRSFSEL